MVYSGQPRHLKECHPNHKATFDQANPNWDIDVFGHIWYDDNWVKPGYEHTHLTENLSKRAQTKVLKHQQRKGGIRLTSDTKDFIQEQWQPKKIVFEKPRYFQSSQAIASLKRGDYKSKPVGPTQISNILSMMYSIEEANNLKKAYEETHQFKYDCVIRIRSDSYFEFPVGCPVDMNPMEPLDEYDLSKLNFQNMDLERANYPAFAMDDRYLFSNSEIMDKFSKLFSSVDDYPNNLMWSGHCIVGHHVSVAQKLPTLLHHWLSTLWRKRGSLDTHPTEASKQYFYKLRKQAIEAIAGKEVAQKNAAALRWLCGMPEQKISSKEISDLTSFYKASGLLLETDEKPAWYCRQRIRRNPKNVTHSFTKKLEKGLSAYILKQQLMGYVEKLRAMIKKAIR